MEDEVVRIAKKMDKMVQKKNAAGALDLLKELKNIPMTLELLQVNTQNWNYWIIWYFSF
ncbi:hypothetical protein MC885_013770 [Smutsia gigantea]|nr:hypothetical protein MC885_013770 [Smutsia gigantea]